VTEQRWARLPWYDFPKLVVHDEKFNPRRALCF